VQNILARLYPEFKQVMKTRIVNAPELNAFAMPNGSIYINVGMLARMNNEAQLATVLAHEGAHFIRKHSVKHKENANAAAVVGLSVGLLSGIPIAGQLLALSSIFGYSRDMEREADQLGYQRYIAAGYRPDQAAHVFKHLKKEVELREDEEPFFFSTHPQLEERIASYEELATSKGEEGFIHEGRYRQITSGLMEETLAHYIKSRRYKTVIYLLESGTYTSRLPDYRQYYLGEAYRQRREEGDSSRAEAAFKVAISQSPDHMDTYRSLGMLYLKDKKYSAAKYNFEKYLTKSDDQYVRGYLDLAIKKLEDK